MKVLAGDIGGTKTRLAEFDVSQNRLRRLRERAYPSQAFDSLDVIVADFLGADKAGSLQACFGIAGPVRAGRCHTTNLPWVIDAAQLSRDFGFARVELLNDLQANAWGIGALADDDFYVLNAGQADAMGNASIIAAGTGLGEAGLFWDGQRHWPFASEGGHADFSPRNELEIALLGFLSRTYEHVSWERVVSGNGLVNIHAFLRDYRRVAIPGRLQEAIAAGDAAAAISGAALSGEDALCNEALDLFIYLYGAEAGNHALKIMATGGVYIGGGIAPKVFNAHNEQLFMRGFFDKGRMRSLMEAMPVRLIRNDRTALYGPALYLAATAAAT